MPIFRHMILLSNASSDCIRMRLFNYFVLFYYTHFLKSLSKAHFKLSQWEEIKPVNKSILMFVFAFLKSFTYLQVSINVIFDFPPALLSRDRNSRVAVKGIFNKDFYLF